MCAQPCCPGFPSWGRYQPEGLSKSNDLLAVSLLLLVLWTLHPFRLIPAHFGSNQRCLMNTYTPVVSATIKSPPFSLCPTFNCPITTANATREVLSVFPVHLQAVLSPEFIHSSNISSSPALLFVPQWQSRSSLCFQYLQNSYDALRSFSH